MVYVPNASRSVSVVQSLISAELKPDYLARVQDEYVRVIEQHQRSRKHEEMLTLEQARANRFPLDLQKVAPAPLQPGVHVWQDVDLEVLRDYIDWTPFFLTWQLSGKFPAILNHAEVGLEARRVYQDANAMLDRMIAERKVTGRAVFGLFPANSDGDDIIVWTDESRAAERCRLFNLRQQVALRNKAPNCSLADFIAPVDSGIADYIGAFAVSTGFGADEFAAEFAKAHDDYNSIMVLSLIHI